MHRTKLRPLGDCRLIANDQQRFLRVRGLQKNDFERTHIKGIMLQQILFS